MQAAVVALVVLWAGWHTFGHLLPLRQRRLRGWLARQLQPWLPAAIVARIRPGFPVTGCGCGNPCAPGKTDAAQ